MARPAGPPPIEGHVEPGFEPVADEFRRNFTERWELGAASAVALAHSRGLIDYDERVCTYWPEFAQAGKERITVRQLLAHQAGLCAIDEPLDSTKLADLDLMARILARQRPAWEPGTRHGYHGLSLGWYEGELIRRVDPQHRSLGRFVAD